MGGDTKKPGEFFSDPTRRVTQSGGDDGQDDPLRNQTRRIDAPRQARPKRPSEGAGLEPAATRLWRPGQEGPEGDGPAATEAGQSAAPADAPQTADDFVVGWLVIVAGPGQGFSLPLGYGWNSIGRGDDQRIRLDFGDGEISRENHCAIAYDGKNRKFFIQHGGGRNLTYVGDTPVLAPQELTADATISIGSTSLRFVPFCGEQFDWADLGGSADQQE